MSDRVEYDPATGKPVQSKRYRVSFEIEADSREEALEIARSGRIDPELDGNVTPLDG